MKYSYKTTNTCSKVIEFDINNDIITNILYVLDKVGLIKYSLTTLKQDSDTFQNVKTIYQLDWLTNTLN